MSASAPRVTRSEGPRADPALPAEDAPATATCPFCDEVVALIFEANRRLLVADHLDVYPTRVCEGSGRVAQIINGHLYISKGLRHDD